MMVGLGVSGMGGHHGLGYMASMFHLFTHAMFKALLFLGAGSVIHAVHSNEMSQMGGLRKYLPFTHITFLIACLAIAGIPPFSGFFSKDEILAATFEHSQAIGWIMSFIAGLTAFYMFRLYFGIFWGKDKQYHHKPHESPMPMLLPLITLAVITIFAGFIPFGEFVTNDYAPYHIHLNMQVAITSVVIAVIAIVLATILYRKENKIPEKLALTFSGLHKAASNRFYIDEVYQFITKKIIFKNISTPIAWFDRHIIDATMDGFAITTQWFSARFRFIQSGKVQQYAWMILLATLIIAALVIFI
jgi:NADH-quinone oxidoreductase subunit L